MAEQLDLTTPVPHLTTSSYRVTLLTLDWGNSIIYIELTSNVGEKLLFNYLGQTATNLMTSLNKMDLSTVSLQKRIINKLVADGKLDGTVSGTPD